MAIAVEKKAKLITDYRRHEGDTGSPEVQIAMLTERIVQLTDHLRTHRHDYASRLVQQGVDLYRVKELLGHSSFELTQRYAHLSDEAKREAVEVLS